MRTAFSEPATHFPPARNLEIPDRASAYPWIVTPPKAGRCLILAGNALYNRPAGPREHQSNYGQPKTNNPQGAPLKLSPPDVRAIRSERDRTGLSFGALGRKYGVTDDVARAACHGLGRYGAIA